MGIQMAYRTLCIVVALVSLALSRETLDLSFPIPEVTEGDGVITVQCELNSGVAIDRDAVCGFSVKPGLSPPAENIYDVANVTEYICTIPTGQTTGTVDIPLYTDAVIDNDEKLGLICVPCVAGDVAGTTATVTITDDNAGDVITLVPRKTVYYATEGDTLSVKIDAYDINKKSVPLEEDIVLEWTFPSEFNEDTATGGEDYNTAVESITQVFSGSSDGLSVFSVTMDFVTWDNFPPENLESVRIVLSGTSANAESDTTTTITVYIADDDKRDLYTLTSMASLPRRSKKTVHLAVFTDEFTTNSGFQISTIPYTRKTYEKNNLNINGATGENITLSRKNGDSRNRFNEYFFWTNLMVSGIEYAVSAYTYLSPGNSGKSGIQRGPTVSVLPADYPCTRLAWNVDVTAPYALKYGNQLKWRFVPDGGKTNNVRFLRKYNGKHSITIADCAETGLYIISRNKGFRRGQIAFVRVILADCPDGWVHSSPSTKDCATESSTVCHNRGSVDPALDLCTCPLGFAGQSCEIALPIGRFGSNNEFKYRDFPPRHNKGKCYLFGLTNPYGTTCAAGWYGGDCCKACPIGSFGANCAQECHCYMNAVCDSRSGVCPSGCADTYFGTNCQQGGPL